MTRAEIEEVAEEFERIANENSARLARSPMATGCGVARDSYSNAARMLREALAKADKCPGCGHTKHIGGCWHGFERFPAGVPDGAIELAPGSGCHCAVKTQQCRTCGHEVIS